MEEKVMNSNKIKEQENKEGWWWRILEGNGGAHRSRALHERWGRLFREPPFFLAPRISFMV